jgi:hypothetical protein
MTAFVTLAGVYSTPEFRVERSREQEWMSSRALEQFLAGVEKRAFKIAQLSLRNDDDALDAVQDAMMKLVQSYGSRGSEEWRPLFYGSSPTDSRYAAPSHGARTNHGLVARARRGRRRGLRSDRAGAEP